MRAAAQPLKCKMGRALFLSPPTKTTSHLIVAAIARPPPPVKFQKYPPPSSSSSFPSAQVKFRHSSSHRFLSSCCSKKQEEYEESDMEKYKESFARRMAMAGLKPHHRIGKCIGGISFRFLSALGVSGGPDSMALCVLAAAWKAQGCDVASRDRSEFIDGLLAIIVDHGLRAESTDEANLASRRVADMGKRSSHGLVSSFKSSLG